LKHQRLVLDHVAQYRPHRATSGRREILEEASEELVEEITVHHEVAEPDEAASHPQQPG
jgi:hypothetical protein